MHRTWLVLLVFLGVVLAGCSAPGLNPTAGDGSADVTYPDGWGPDGPENASQAIQRADEAVAGQDFVERRVAVQTTPNGTDSEYLVDVLVVQVDRERERLVTERRFYLVDAELAASVTQSGLAPLSDRRADEVRRTYLDSSGGEQFYRLGERPPRITTLESGDFASAIDQPLPAVLVNSQPVVESATYGNPTQADGGVTYSISTVSAFQLSDGAGALTVGNEGLVSSFNVSESGQGSHDSFRYDLEVGDVSIDRPEWASGEDANGTPSE